jgi:DNA uptake protein ComE-like DNA-binding protein
MIILRKRQAFRQTRRGIVLITTMWIAIALAAVVLVLCREMQVEQLTARQHLAQAKADAAELGVEQLVMSVVEQELVSPGYKDSVVWQQRQIGDCYFWVFRLNVDDEGQAAYGIEDEASKVDLNTATDAMLEMLPGIDPITAASIVDWRDPDDTVTVSEITGAMGAESDYYLANFGYRAKNSKFETVDELRLLSGIADASVDPNLYLHGADLNHNGVIDEYEYANADQGMGFLLTQRGILPYVTVYGYQATNPPEGTEPVVPTQLSDVTYQYPIDINNQDTFPILQQLFQQYIPNKMQQITNTMNQHFPTGGGGRGGGTQTPTPFTNVWQFFIQAQLTSQDLSTTTSDGSALFNLLTCLPPTSTNATPTTYTDGTTSTTVFAKINVNTATEAALMCLPGFEQQDADDIIQYREQYLVGQDPLQVPNISWLLDVLAPEKLVPTQAPGNTQPSLQAGSFITGTSTVFSADIVTVTQDGRAFKRVKVIVDASSGTPVIVNRQDLTEAGWPMNPAVRPSYFSPVVGVDA